MTNISSNMYQGLASLLDINSQMQDVQTRLSTGKKLNSAADGAVQWLTVSNFQTKVSGLQAVNDGMTTALSQLKSASTALNLIRKTINDTLSQLKEASRTQAAVNNLQQDAVSDNGMTKFNLNFTMNGGGQVKRTTNLGDVNLRVNNVALAQGSIYSITAGSNARFIEISNTGDTATGGDGSFQANAIKVKTVGDLYNALLGFTNVTLAGEPGNDNAFNQINTQFTYNAANGLTFSQVRACNQGTVNPDIASVFAAGRAYSVSATAGVGDDIINSSGSVGSQTITMKGQNHTGARGTATVAADAKCAVAANAVVSLVDQINQLVRDARTNGVNLLAGDDLRVVVNAENNTMTFQFGTSASPQSFAAAGLGIDLTVLKLTGTMTTNFDNDTDLNAAITALSSARNASDIGISKLSTWQSGLQTRSDFNNSITKILTAAITSLTSSDATADAAELASLQSRQTFANSILSIIKQGEQNPLQLLR